ncbi:LysR family transcriptional regulator [Vibrio gallicus]|uniref:LysR family transcriptional regulator n=1 Tax=Vibrio gallicus TaxID=190897 RepID=UPI0021C429B7|nr:LysR family transcriptional regulator [Vibrio gallicus]
MNSNDLILFSQVVELGSFSKAADRNNLTNSVVSKRISRLEQQIGVQLLYRSTRKLSLTEAGKALYIGSRNVRQATQEALDAVSKFDEKIEGHIKMSVPTISGDLLLADAVSEFCNQNPGLSVDMSLDNRFVELIEDGFDLVIRTGYMEQASLVSQHIIDSQWIVCASPTYIAQNGRPLSPYQLSEFNCLQYAYQLTGANEWEFKTRDNNYFVHVSGTFSTDNAGALRKAALGGRGIAYVPRCLVYQDLKKGTLIDLFPEQVAKNLGIYAVYPYSKYPPQKIKMLIEHIKQRYQKIAHYF